MRPQVTGDNNRPGSIALYGVNTKRMAAKPRHLEVVWPIFLISPSMPDAPADTAVNNIEQYFLS